MTQSEYKHYLYNLFTQETDGMLHPKKEYITRLYSEGNLSTAYLRKELDLMGIEYQDHITITRTLRRATAQVLHSVATIMSRHHLSFDEAMDVKYREERWALLLLNGAKEQHKEQLLLMTKAQLVDGVL